MKEQLKKADILGLAIIAAAEGARAALAINRRLLEAESGL